MKEQLEAIGFDSKEAEIYIALTKLGKAGVTEILKNTGIERRSIYDILERLVQKGRASYYEENGTRIFSPTNPNVILAELKHRQDSFAEIIPRLEALETPKGAKVEILKGEQGLMTVFYEVIESGLVHYSWGDISPLIYIEKYARIVKKFLSQLEKKGMVEKIIYAKGDPISKIKKGEYRALDKKLIPPAPTLIYGDVTTQYVYTEPLTIIKITSKEIAQTNLEYFKHFWNIAKKV
ncbi:helix-turn-helix domain-containing protein [Candidatus Woesearchaeota archaeon]|nr:helix-turn-helix domain-containing protein [Candidatus Woesearchaeota archaeon]